MRAQLIDVAKAIPALAIFAAPGGIYSHRTRQSAAIHARLPSAFQDGGEDEITRVPRS